VTSPQGLRADPIQPVSKHVKTQESYSSHYDFSLWKPFVEVLMMGGKDYGVITEHRASFPYSVELKVGEIVAMTEKEEDGWTWCICKDGLGAWVPKEYLMREDNKGIALVKYNSTELNVKVGERLSCSKEARGWFWCANQKGERGWVPKTKLRRVQNERKKDQSGTRS